MIWVVTGRFREYWLGNRTLPRTFIFLLLLPSVVIIILQRSAHHLHSPSLSPHLTAVAYLLLLLYAAACVVTLIGINRKSRLLAGAYGANTSVALYNLLSLILIGYTLTHIVDLITTNVELSNTTDPVLHSSPAFTDDASMPGVVRLSGHIGIAATKRLEAYLSGKKVANQQMTQLLLNSEGGNIYEARGLARVVAEWQLNTHVNESCLSACTLVYVSGVKRSAGADARFGFHSYRQENQNGGVAINISEQQELDAALFASAGVDKSFIDQLYQAGHGDMWFAGQQLLIEADFINHR